jgi:hypothetical protein
MTETYSTQNLTLLDTVIRRDEAGRFCLNDLHRAAGGEARHWPNYWLETQQTQELIYALSHFFDDAGIPASDKINNLEPVKIVRGFSEGQGTYVCRELVYSYAMWISPEFHIKVIRAYDAMVSSHLPVVTHTRALTVNESAFDMVKTHLSVWELLNVPEHIRQQEVVKQVCRDTGVDFSPALKFAPAQLTVETKDMMLEPTELAHALGFNSAMMANKWLQKMEMQVKTKNGWEPTEKGKAHCANHSWSKGGKQGYNLRWNVVALKELRQSATA